MITHHTIKYNTNDMRVIERKRKKMWAIVRREEKAVCIETLDNRKAK
jgi:hypothetical protein